MSEQTFKQRVLLQKKLLHEKHPHKATTATPQQTFTSQVFKSGADDEYKLFETRDYEDWQVRIH